MNMSDSDSDFLSYPAPSKIMHGHNATSVNGLYQRNYLSSTMDLPRNFEMRRHGESNYTRNNIYYSNDASNMSVRSYREPQHFKQSYIPSRMGSQRSMINGRCTSPISVQSIDSHMTRISAMDVRTALLTNKYNNEELKIIRDGYRKLMKNRTEKRRNKIEKRRNKRYWSKRIQHTFGYDSGDLGSNSSVTSDESRATISNTLYRLGKENISNRSYSEISSHRINSAKLARALRENDMYEDRTVNLKQNSFKNMLNVAPGSMYKSQSEHQNTLAVIPQSQRFKNTVQIGSQRFNNTFSALPFKQQKTMLQVNNKELLAKKNRNNYIVNNQKYSAIHEYESDEEDMIIDNEMNSYKQSDTYIDCNNFSSFSKHREKLDAEKVSSGRNHNKTSSTTIKVNENTNDFPFIKPQLPVKRPLSKTNEKLISQSVQIATDENTVELSHTNTKFQTDEQSETIDHSLSDVSSRPSFMKRKLFTQTLDVTECKNVSSESFNSNSPQSNVYNQLAKEKNKTRKLAMGQSCLSRDINQDKNLLDLIHKIVPPERMNITSATTKDEITAKDMNSNSRKHDTDDKWDVTSIISTYNNNSDISDVYTDEEIISVNFNTTENKKHPSKPFITSKINHETSQTNKNNIVPKRSQKRKSIASNDHVKDFILKAHNQDLQTPKTCSTLLKTNEKLITEKNKFMQNEKKQNDQLPHMKKNNEVIKKKKSYVDRFWDDESDLDKTGPECENKGNSSTVKETFAQENRRSELIPCVAQIPNILTNNDTMHEDQNKNKYNKDKCVLQVTNDDSSKKKKINKECNNKETSSNIDIKKKSRPIQKGKIMTKHKKNPTSKKQLIDNNAICERNSTTNEAVVQEDKKFESVPSTSKLSKQEMIKNRRHIENDIIDTKKLKRTTEESVEKKTYNKNHKSLKNVKCTNIQNKETNGNNTIVKDLQNKNDKPDITKTNKLAKLPNGQLKTANTVQEKKASTRKIPKLSNGLLKSTDIFPEEKTTNIVQEEKNQVSVGQARPIVKIFRCDPLKEKSTRLIRELSSLDTSFLSYSNALSVLSSSCSSQHSMILRKRPLYNSGKKINACCNDSSQQYLQMSVHNNSVRCLRTRHVDISIEDNHQPVNNSITYNTKKPTAKTSQVKIKKNGMTTINKNENVSEILESSRSSCYKEAINNKSSCPNATNIIRSRRSNISFSLRSDGPKKR